MGRSAALAAPAASAVLTKAVLRAADALALRNNELARILGVSDASVSRMGDNAFLLEPGKKEFELGALFVRLYRALDSIVGDDLSARSWLRTHNLALSAAPADLIVTVAGLTDVLRYVDARRAPL